MPDDDQDPSPRPKAAKGGIHPDVWAEAVNEWVNSSLRNSSLAQHTEGWNHLLGVAIADFKKILEKKL